MYLYVRNSPRALYLITSSQDERLGRPPRALVFREGDGSAKAIVEFLSKDQVDLHNLVKLNTRIVKGCLGLISVDSGMHPKMILLDILVLTVSPNALDTFLAVVTNSTEIGNTRPSASHPENVAQIHEVCFYSLTSAAWDDSPTDVAQPPESTLDSTLRDAFNQGPQVFEHPCMPLVKILSSGTFYYAVESQWDISSRLAVRLSRDPKASQEGLTYDERFVWNEYILRSLLDFRDRLDPSEREDMDKCQFLVCFLLC